MISISQMYRYSMIVCGNAVRLLKALVNYYRIDEIIRSHVIS